MKIAIEVQSNYHRGAIKITIEVQSNYNRGAIKIP